MKTALLPDETILKEGPATIIPLSDVSDTSLAWTFLLNILPVVPNSIAVSTLQGQVHNRFVVFGRAAWKEAIDKQRDALRAS